MKNPVKLFEIGLYVQNISLWETAELEGNGVKLGTLLLSVLKTTQAISLKFSIITCICFIHWFALKSEGVQNLCTLESKNVWIFLPVLRWILLVVPVLRRNISTTPIISILKQGYSCIFLFVTLKCVFY